jgi:DNA-binding response OmpR family regulator
VGYVLIVDDTAASCRLLAALLAPDDYDVRTVDDGADALRLIRADPPDLILMDVLMPGVDGFHACRAIKQDPSTWLIPVVLVSALVSTTNRLRGIEAGADDFITKPINGLELRARVRSLLRIKRHTDDLDSAQSVMVSLAMTIEAHDRTTAGHCQRVGGEFPILTKPERANELNALALRIPRMLIEETRTGPGQSDHMSRHRRVPATCVAHTPHAAIGV